MGLLTTLKQAKENGKKCGWDEIKVNSYIESIVDNYVEEQLEKDIIEQQNKRNDIGLAIHVPSRQCVKNILMNIILEKDY